MDLSLKDHLSDAGVKKWVAAVGCTDAPIPRRNIKVALRFFDEQMPRLPIEDAVGFIAAMDLSKSVSRVRLRPGERLLGFRTGFESPFKLFFARRGASPLNLGISTAGRHPVHFVVRSPVLALESFTAPAKDTWTASPRGRIEGKEYAKPGKEDWSVSLRAKKWCGREFGVLASGGASQLIIPESYGYLLVEERMSGGPAGHTPSRRT